MTKQDLLSELSQKAIAVEEDAPEDSGWTGYSSVQVDYLHKRQGAVVEKKAKILIKDSDSTADWFGEVPDILRAPAVPEPKVTEAQVIGFVESLYPDYKVIDVLIRPRKEYDDVTVQVDNGASTFPKNLRAWSISAVPWEKPADASVAYDEGDYVTHNGLYWESDFNENVKEPPDQWTEVDPFIIRESGG